MFDSSIDLVQDIAHNGGTRVRHLVSHKGARVNYNNNEPIRVACAKGQLETVKYLIQKGADPETHGDYCYLIAAQEGHLALLEFLMGRCKNPNRIRNRALILASRKRQYHICVFLIFEQGANMAHLTKTRRGRRRQRFLNYMIENGTNEQLMSIYPIGCGYMKYMKRIKMSLPRYVCSKSTKNDLVGALDGLEKRYRDY